jgi:hypothetical protein
VANWQKKADKEWARVIKEVGHCEWCGRADKQLHAHHIINRTNYAYRHLLVNGVCLCAACHTMDVQAAHTDRTAFYRWLEKERPGVWRWFNRHTIVIHKQVGNREVVVYKPRKFTDHEGDKAEYEKLKEIRK